MTRFSLCLCVSVVILASLAHAQSCSPNEWCEIYSVNPSGFHNNAWNRLNCVKDTGRCYLNANNLGGITPENNATWYMEHPDVPTAMPWTKVSSCGDELATQRNGYDWHLAESITAAESGRIHIRMDTGLANMKRNEAVNYAGGAVIQVGNENIHFDKCTTTDDINATACPAASAQSPLGPDLYLWNLRRGQRQLAGWHAAEAHTGSLNATDNPTPERVGWACYNPALGTTWNDSGDPNDSDFANGTKRDGNGDSLWDHWVDRHDFEGSPVYDSKRGRLWVAFGKEEVGYLTDTYSLCIYATGSDSDPDPSTPNGWSLSSCRPKDLYTAASTTHGWTRISSSPPALLYDTGHDNNSLVYDPSTDVLLELGGMRQGTASANHLHIFCLSAEGGSNGLAMGCDADTVGTWVMLTPGTPCGAGTGHYCGNPGERDGVRAVYFPDPAKPRTLWFSGKIVGTSNSYFGSVAHYDSKAGNFCLSHTTEGYNQANAAGCNLPAESGPLPKTVVNYANGPCSTPPCGNTRLNFPDWVFDKAQGRGLWYGGPAADDGGGFYSYDAGSNTWAALTLSSTNWPVSMDGYKGHSNLAYEETTQTLYWVQGGSNPYSQLWRLPESAFGSTPPPPGSTTSYSGLTISGAQIQ